jgi:hypothetical protein
LAERAVSLSRRTLPHALVMVQVIILPAQLTTDNLKVINDEGISPRKKTQPHLANKEQKFL